MAPVSPASIAGRLKRSQISTVINLDENFCILGCSESCAIRLTKDTMRRPALVEEGPRSDNGYRTFRLSVVGQSVQKILLSERGLG